MLALYICVFTTVFSISFAYDANGNNGQFVTCSSPDPAPYQLCGSGETGKCNGQENTLRCGGWLGLFSSPSNITYEIGPNTDGSWGCYKQAKISCPAGKLLFGICGSSGSGSQCTALCPNGGGVFAQYCATPPAPFGVRVGGGTWQTAGYGVFLGCPQNYAPCGSCESGKSADCGGDNHWTSLECCPIYDCTPTNITGKWVPVKAGTTAGDNVQVEIGVSMTAGVSYSQGYSQTVSISMEQGMYFAGTQNTVIVGGEYSKYMTLTCAAALSASAGYTYTASCSTAPFVLWQFQLTVEGSCGSTVFIDAYVCTTTAATPPGCLPGYGLDTSYSKCVPGSPNVCDSA